MIRFLQGDIFASKAQVLVATVNCVGIMGKGLAKEFRQRFPEMYKEYVKVCKKGELRRGQLYFYKDLHAQILCFPTKDNWKGPSKYEFIEDGLKTLVKNYREWEIGSIAIPPLGCGMGGLEWSKVKGLIVKYLSKLSIDIEIYEPLESGDRIPRRNPFKNIIKVKLTPSSVYTGEMIRIARKMFPKDVPVSRFLLQKIAFFSQVAGVPIKLKFQKYKLGPFDYALTFNVDRLEGLYVRDESPTLMKSNLVILDENQWLKAIEKLGLELVSIRKRIEKSVFFLSQFSIPHIELLSTVLLAWGSLVSAGYSGSTEEIVSYIQNWKYQKFSKEDIIKAMDELIKFGWLNPDESLELSLALRKPLVFHNNHL